MKTNTPHLPAEVPTLVLAPETTSEARPPPAEKVSVISEPDLVQKEGAEDTPPKLTETRPTKPKRGALGPRTGLTVTECPSIKPFALKWIPPFTEPLD